MAERSTNPFAVNALMDWNIAAFLTTREDVLSVSQKMKDLAPGTVWHRKLGTRYWRSCWVHGPDSVDWSRVHLKNGRTQWLGPWLKENGYDPNRKYEQPKGDCSLDGIVKRLVELENRVGVLEDR